MPTLTLCLATVWNWLERLGLPLKRSAPRQRSPDPAYQEKKQHLQAARQRAAQDPQHWVHLDLDETSGGQRPTLAPTYAAAGRAPPQQGQGREEALRTWFGAVDTTSGLLHVHQAPSGTAEHLVVFLEQLLASYPGKKVSVGLDNWKPHLADKTLKFCRAQGGRLELIYLPTYSPWLMAMERVWKDMRSKVTHNHPFGAMEEVSQRWREWAEEHRQHPEGVLRLIAAFVPNPTI